MLNGIMHSFSKYLFIIYYVPGTILGIGKLAVSKQHRPNKTKQKKKTIPAFMEFTYTQR